MKKKRTKCDFCENKKWFFGSYCGADRLECFKNGFYCSSYMPKIVERKEK